MKVLMKIGSTDKENHSEKIELDPEKRD